MRTKSQEKSCKKQVRCLRRIKGHHHLNPDAITLKNIINESDHWMVNEWDGSIQPVYIYKGAFHDIFENEIIDASDDIEIHCKKGMIQFFKNYLKKIHPTRKQNYIRAFKGMMLKHLL